MTTELYTLMIILFEMVLIICFLILRKRYKEFENSMAFRIDLKYISITIIIIVLVEYFLSFFIPPIPLKGFYPMILSLLVAPIFEEFVFRGFFIGVLYEILSKIFDKNKVIIGLLLLNPFLFSISHILVGMNIVITCSTFTPRFVVGLVLASFYWLSNRNLIPVILAHSISNLCIYLGL